MCQVSFIVLICLLSTLDAFLHGYCPRTFAPKQFWQTSPPLSRETLSTRILCTVSDENTTHRCCGASRAVSKSTGCRHVKTSNDGRDRMILMQKLLEYDNGELTDVKTKHKMDTIKKLEMGMVDNIINDLRDKLSARGYCTDLFGERRNNALEGMVGSISQTFSGELLYPTVETQAAQLRYSVLKGHPCVDGNKRIAVSLFIKFLEMNRYLVDEHGDCVLDNGLLLSLVIDVAKSKAKDQADVIQTIVDMLIRES